MTTDFVYLEDEAEMLLAELTEAAYRVALRQGLKEPFVDVQMRLWRELRHVLLRRKEAIPCPNM